jgi:ketosteroid isomerase-like protein
MRRLTLWAGIVCLFAAALTVACGGGGGSGGGDQPQDDEAAIRKVVSDFGKAFNDGKAGDLYSLLDAESRKNCSQKEIETLLNLVKAFSGNKKFTAEATTIKVNGDKATAQVVAAIGDEKQSPEENALVKEGGKWKLSFGAEDCSV